MRIAIAGDEVGSALAAALIEALEGDGYSVLDLGAATAEPVDDPDWGRAVGQAVIRGFVDTGVLVCSAALGAVIAANKILGIRAVLCPDAATAREARATLDANLLCLSARSVTPEVATDVARAWLDTPFS